MIAKTLIKQIKNDRNGYIMVEISNFDDIFFVRGVKSDILRMLSTFEPTQETGLVLDNDGYLSKQYDYMN